MADKDKVVGRALYAEFRSGAQTYQMIITPDGLTADGRNVPSTIYRRQVSATKPRRAWKTYALPKLQQEPTGVYTSMTEELALSQASSRLTYIESSFLRMEGYGYKLYMKPLIIEVSQADLDDIRASKTPYKILGRITRVRKALGFGEKLFA